MPDIFETMLIVGAGVAEPLLALDVPAADSRGVVVIVALVLKDAATPEAPIHMPGSHINNRCSNNGQTGNQKQ